MKFNFSITFIMIAIAAIAFKSVSYYLKEIYLFHFANSFFSTMFFYCFFRSFIKIYPFFLGIPILIFIYCLKALGLASSLNILDINPSYLINIPTNNILELANLISCTTCIVIIITVDFKLILNRNEVLFNS